MGMPYTRSPHRFSRTQWASMVCRHFDKRPAAADLTIVMCVKNAAFWCLGSHQSDSWCVFGSILHACCISCKACMLSHTQGRALKRGAGSWECVGVMWECSGRSGCTCMCVHVAGTHTHACQCDPRCVCMNAGKGYIGTNGIFAWS
jgi:hypothetical protein